MTERYGGDEKKKDIHEMNREYLRRSREAADYCAARLGWHTVECSDDRQMRSITSIHNEILEITRECLGL